MQERSSLVSRSKWNGEKLPGWAVAEATSQSPSTQTQKWIFQPFLLNNIFSGVKPGLALQQDGCKRETRLTYTGI